MEPNVDVFMIVLPFGTETCDVDTCEDAAAVETVDCCIGRLESS